MSLLLTTIFGYEIVTFMRHWLVIIITILFHFNFTQVKAQYMNANINDLNILITEQAHYQSITMQQRKLLWDDFLQQEFITLEQESTKTQAQQPKFQKLKAVVLTIFLGHFGVHRIYLGTTASVPVVYSLTLGGGLGLLPLVDLIVILTSKDLEQYSNNDRVIMWVK